jgi:hypothetical protein
MSMKHYLMSTYLLLAPKAFDGEKLKITYESGDDVPEAFKSLYTEKDGKFHLTGVEGMKTDGDVAKLTGALNKERSDHKKLRDSIRGALGIAQTDPLPNFEEIRTKLDSVDELQAQVEAAGDPKNAKKIEELVDAKVKAKLAPVEKELNTAREQLGLKDKTIGELTTEKRTRKVQDTVREHAAKLKLLPEAMDDAFMYAQHLFEEDDSGALVMKEGTGFTQGTDVNFWLTEMQSKKPHWWPASEGGGAGGKGGGKVDTTPNPFSHENWNMTLQGQMINTDRVKAERMAAAAGTKIGGPKPAPKK